MEDRATVSDSAGEPGRKPGRRVAERFGLAAASVCAFGVAAVAAMTGLNTGAVGVFAASPDGGTDHPAVAALPPSWPRAHISGSELAPLSVAQPVSRVNRAAGAAAARAVAPGVVDISTLVPEGAGAGTGIVLTTSGEVLTNNHVVDGASLIEATDVGNGHVYRAAVIGRDRGHDLAVLQLLGATNLQTASVSKAAASVGDVVVGVGNGEGAGTPNWAIGTVTGLDRSITATDATGGSPERMSGMIASNAGILPGDSGGPLVNLAGQVVGLDTAGAFASEMTDAPAEASFAIPIAQAVAVAAQLTAHGSA